MEKIRLTRRTVVQTAATAALAAPFVRGAHAAGKLAVGFWDHWVPGANDTLTKLCQRMGGQGEGRDQDRLHHLAGRQAQSDPGGGGAGAIRARHADLPDLGGTRAGRQSRSRSTN